MGLFVDIGYVIGAMCVIVKMSHEEPILHQVETCSDEEFRGECGSDEVILIQSAHYGRRFGGRCVQQKVGEDCNDSVEEWVASQCSGKRWCKLSVSKTLNPYLRTHKPCSTELTWHLNVTYSCIKVQTADIMKCKQNNFVSTTSTSGYLVTSVAKVSLNDNRNEPMPGSPLCHWEIRVRERQKIQLLAYNFINTRAIGQTSSPCNNFATVKEGPLSSQLLSMCARVVSYKEVYLSDTNVIQFYFTANVLKTSHNASDTEYLVRYQAIGCADLPKIHGAHFIRSGDRDLTVKCNSTGDTWQLECDGVEWKGRLSNCSQTKGPVTGRGGDDGWTVVSDGTFPFGLVLVVAIGVALGILLGGTTLIIISYRMKRKYPPQYEIPPEACINYNTGGSMRSVKQHIIPYKNSNINQSPNSVYTANHNNASSLTPLRRPWSGSSSVPPPPPPPPPQSTLHHQTVPDYNFNSNEKKEQLMTDNSRSAGGSHLYESPHIT